MVLTLPRAVVPSCPPPFLVMKLLLTFSLIQSSACIRNNNPSRFQTPSPTFVSAPCSRPPQENGPLSPALLSRVSPSLVVRGQLFHVPQHFPCLPENGALQVRVLPPTRRTSCQHLRLQVLLSSTHSVPSSHHDCLLQCSDVLSHSHNPTTQQSDTKKKAKWT